MVKNRCAQLLLNMLDIDINANPTFMYFDTEGHLVDIRVGYRSDNQEVFRNDILQFIRDYK